MSYYIGDFFSFYFIPPDLQRSEWSPSQLLAIERVEGGLWVYYSAVNQPLVPEVLRATSVSSSSFLFDVSHILKHLREPQSIETPGSAFSFR